MLCFLLILLPSCTKDSELLLSNENIAENITEPTTAEQLQDSVPTTIVTDSIISDTVEDTGNKIASKTKLSISGNQFYINGQLTYKGRYWQGKKIEGLLMNSRMVQGIFDDSNNSTKQQFAYADTGTWDPDRNTNEFIDAMSEWKSKGLLAFTLNLQGGSPTGYGNSQPWVNSAFNSQGTLKADYLKRLTRVLDRADELNMVVILGYFYFGQDQVLQNETAVLNAVDNITNWLLEKGYENLLIEVNNECDHQAYDHAILRSNRVHELVQRVNEKQLNGKRLLVSTSYKGGNVPSSEVINSSDYIILHGNGVHSPSSLRNLIVRTREIGQNKPIIINEDDHFDFDKADYNFLAAIDEYASWGYFDFRKQGETYKDGFQTVPVDWGINSERKISFFNKVKDITGY
jgi:hypothetical protein